MNPTGYDRWPHRIRSVFDRLIERGPTETGLAFLDREFQHGKTIPVRMAASAALYELAARMQMTPPAEQAKRKEQRKAARAFAKRMKLNRKAFDAMQENIAEAAFKVLNDPNATAEQVEEARQIAVEHLSTKMTARELFFFREGVKAGRLEAEKERWR